MATGFNGVEAKVYGAGYALHPFLKSAKLSGKRNVYDASVLGSLWRVFKAGRVSGELNAEGLHTTAALEFGPLADAMLNTTKAFMVCPEGDLVGSMFGGIEGSVVAKSIQTGNTDLAMAVLNVIAKGGVDLGYVVHAETAETATFTGSTVDTGIVAASAGGALYINVTAYSGTAGQMTFKFEHSTDGSSWADITGGAVAAASFAAGYNDKIHIPPSVAINRYVRCSGVDAGAMTSTTFTAGVAKHK